MGLFVISLRFCTDEQEIMKMLHKRNCSFFVGTQRVPNGGLRIYTPFPLKVFGSFSFPCGKEYYTFYSSILSK